MSLPCRYVNWKEPLDFYTRRLQEFVKSTGFIENGTFLNPVRAEPFYKSVPEFKELFERHGLDDLHGVAVIRALPFDVAPNYPHTDTPTVPNQSVALNWPVFNCENTFTAFYNLKEGAIAEPLQLSNGSKYTRYQYDMVEEFYRIRVDKPVALRVDVLHAVINETKSVRITVSFRFKTNHWELFNG